MSIDPKFVELTADAVTVISHNRITESQGQRRIVAPETRSRPQTPTNCRYFEPDHVMITTGVRIFAGESRSIYAVTKNQEAKSLNYSAGAKSSEVGAGDTLY